MRHFHFIQPQRRRRSIGAGLLTTVVAALLTASPAAADVADVHVERDAIAFGDVPVGTPSRYENLVVRNRSEQPSKFRLDVRQTGTDFKVEAADGGPLGRTLAPRASAVYLVRFTPGRQGASAATVEFGDPAQPSAQPTARVALSGTGTVSSTTPGGNPNAARHDLRLQVTGTFRGGTPVFGASSTLSTNRTRTVRSAGLIAVRISNVGPAQTSDFLLELWPIGDRKVIDRKRLPSPFQPFGQVLLRTNSLAPLGAGQQRTFIFRLGRSVRNRPGKLWARIAGGNTDSNIDDNRGRVLIKAGSGKPSAKSPGSGVQTAPTPSSTAASDIDVDADRDRAPYANPWRIEAVHPTKDLAIARYDQTTVRVHVVNRGPVNEKDVRVKIRFPDTDRLDPSGIGLPADCTLKRAASGSTATIECSFALAAGSARDIVFKFWAAGHKLAGEKSAKIDITAEGANPKADPNPLNNHVDLRAFTK